MKADAQIRLAKISARKDEGHGTGFHRKGAPALCQISDSILSAYQLGVKFYESVGFAVLWHRLFRWRTCPDPCRATEVNSPLRRKKSRVISGPAFPAENVSNLIQGFVMFD